MSIPMQRQLPLLIAELVARFDQNVDAYRNAGYNETQLRREFLDPFFDALGWDVSNRGGLAEAYKDVIHEDALKVGGDTKAPDYCFRVGGKRIFFVEAKKPATNVKGDPAPAYQVRRYAWSAKLPLSILTDFEEFAVYDCRTRPSLNDKSSTGRILDLKYSEYADRWNEIASIFSKDAVLKGSFDKFAISERRRGTATVDAAFLAEIEGWREALARNLALRNPSLTVHEINFAVQRTIDRLIFLRICEDRGVETYGELRTLLNGENIYGRLRHLYGIADERYNSGLFHFHAEKGRAEAPDELTPALQIDDKVLKDMIGGLYYPESPYEFSVFPIEILGQVYEQFLGKVIRLTPARHAKIEEKPEVRKAGGVYYTPSYIVDYIVTQTVGRLCEGKTPKQIAGLRILDPACGSGSFLIGAYASLLNYHRDWYLKDGASKHTKEIYQGTGGQWYLTTPEKKRILLNNIYGVDIDSQAVEVTKLSLLLKVLEGENQETLNRQLKMWRERALPDLGNNIKCGNSLIDPDYFAGQLLPDEEAMRHINPFDWRREFPEIMEAGGFDVVIGNPPWGAELSTAERAFLTLQYPAVPTKTKDSYMYFLLRSLYLLHTSGMLGFIIPNTWLLINTASDFRRQLLSLRVSEIIDHGDGVFKRATVESSTLIVVKRRDQDSTCHVVRMRRGTPVVDRFIKKQVWLDDALCRIVVDLDDRAQRLLARLKSKSTPFRECCVIIWGIKPYQVGYGVPAQTREMVQKRIYHSETKRGDAWKPLVVGTNVNRYEVHYAGNQYIKYGKWLMYPSDESLMLRPKLLLRQTSDTLRACYDEQGYYCQNSVFIIHSDIVNLKVLLALLNSRLLGFVYKLGNPQTGKIFAEIKPSVIKELPIRTFDLSDTAARTEQGRLVMCVERISDLYKRLRVAKAPDERSQLQRQIDATDREIDSLVYKLYELTPDEITIVEGSRVASTTESRENITNEDEAQPADRSYRPNRQDQGVATSTQHAGEGGGILPGGASGAGRGVDGVREAAGEYGAPEGPTGGPEEEKRVGSTRFFQTAQGSLSYTQVSERLGVSLAALLDEVASASPEQITITPEWLCLRHRALAGDLFPDWAGRYRDVNVQVGLHTPPPFFEVPGRCGYSAMTSPSGCCTSAPLKATRGPSPISWRGRTGGFSGFTRFATSTGGSAAYCSRLCSINSCFPTLLPPHSPTTHTGFIWKPSAPLMQAISIR
jgi:hypothetical protein